jgi:phosphoribosylformylglycinamidine cyclo-ligase
VKPEQERFSYADAGVDIRAAEGLTKRLAALVASTRSDAVQGDFGSFGGRFKLSGDPELVASADGVGTKVLVARMAGRHDTVGQDLVNHCVNDILAEGAVPLFFLDYFACGTLDPDVAFDVVAGIARGCRENGCALLGGETAEMPGMYDPGDYDLAGFIVGRVALPLPGREAVSAGDLLVALPSSGLHTNGYSLARGILFDRLGLDTDDEYPGTGRSVGDVLLEVHRSYLRPLSDPCDRGAIRALAHITGGGIPGNLSRVLPAGCDARVDLKSWHPGPVFDLLARESGLGPDDLYGTLNMGVGMIAVVEAGEAEAVIEQIRAAGTRAFVCGEVSAGQGRVLLERAG